MIHRYFVDDMLMVRVGPEALWRAHARKMDFTAKSLKKFVYFGVEAFADGLAA